MLNFVTRKQVTWIFSDFSLSLIQFSNQYKGNMTSEARTSTKLCVLINILCAKSPNICRGRYKPRLWAMGYELVLNRLSWINNCCEI